MFKWLEQYLAFTKSERNAIIGLMVLIILVVAIPRLYLRFKPAEQVNNSNYLKQAEEFARSNNKAKDEGANAETGDNELKPIESQSIIPTAQVDSAMHIVKKAADNGYFNFDPNKIGVAEWVKLGFTEKQATTIEHYKATGAKFYKAEDLKKLFVMTDEHYEKLLPYVHIDGDALPKRKYHRGQ